MLQSLRQATEEKKSVESFRKQTQGKNPKDINSNFPQTTQTILDKFPCRGEREKVSESELFQSSGSELSAEYANIHAQLSENHKKEEKKEEGKKYFLAQFLFVCCKDIQQVDGIFSLSLTLSLASHPQLPTTHLDFSQMIFPFENIYLLYVFFYFIYKRELLMQDHQFFVSLLPKTLERAFPRVRLTGLDVTETEQTHFVFLCFVT